ncbi:TraB/GumN family protein [Noviherbaspirillum cavernae]|uniref:TraB/GumN family protein n=1 Tax=Noviherbaspirillum cavernae TaxID=2320862 RepID=A0A418WXD1_9BURK|nr:TraB/GumN family protein [Noviherbaspirillum cavernae]RJG04884.1 TraB/GumN family protein [Noviherbaspirillum cavernae]
MKHKIMIALSSLLLAFAGADSLAESNVAAPAASVQKSASPPQRGSLFRVRHHDNTAYLFGTIHVGQPSLYPLESEVTQAFNRAGTLAVEIDIFNTTPFQQAIATHGMYANGDTLDRRLSADSLRQLKLALNRFSIPFDNARPMKPWMVAIMLTTVELERNGYQTRYGIEPFLLVRAKEQGKTIVELESADYQMSLFAAMSDAQQERFLVETLAELADGKLVKKTGALFEAWSSANGKALEAFMREELGAPTPSAEFMQRVMIDKRNPEMAQKVEAMLKGGGTTFVGVGLLHLMGEKGVPELLRQRGYQVEKLY